MRKAPGVVIAGVMLVSAVSAPAADTAASVRTADTAATAVTRLYRDFAWETVIVDPPQPGLVDQPREVLAKYFDDRLTALILRDRECARTTHEACALDFLPLWDGQDVGATDLAIRGTSDPSIVEVTFRFAGKKDRKRKLTYRLTHGTSGWRVTDIRSPDWSLLSLLGKKQ